MADGFEFKFTNRNSWKAERRDAGKLLDVVPVSWTKGMRFTHTPPDRLLEVWFRDPAELQQRRADPKPFVVAVAEAKDWQAFPHAVKQFVGVFEVTATGAQIDENSIETRILRRLTAGKEPT